MKSSIPKRRAAAARELLLAAAVVEAAAAGAAAISTPSLCPPRPPLGSLLLWLAGCCCLVAGDAVLCVSAHVEEFLGWGGESKQRNQPMQPSRQGTPDRDRSMPWLPARTELHFTHTLISGRPQASVATHTYTNTAARTLLASGWVKVGERDDLLPTPLLKRCRGCMAPHNGMKWASNSTPWPSQPRPLSIHKHTTGGRGGGRGRACCVRLRSVAPSSTAAAAAAAVAA